MARNVILHTSMVHHHTCMVHHHTCMMCHHAKLSYMLENYLTGRTKNVGGGVSPSQLTACLVGSSKFLDVVVIDLFGLL